MQPARTRLQVDERRAQLIELGLEMFGDVTYDELSVDDIAKKAGISKGLLYHYFPSKRAFYVAVVREAAEQFMAETDIGEPADEPQLVRIRRAIVKFLDYVTRRRETYLFLLSSGVGADDEVAAILDETRRAMLTRVLLRLVKVGASPNDPSTRLRLRGWIGFLEAASLDWAANGDLESDAFVDLLVETGGDIVAKVLSAPSAL